VPYARELWLPLVWFLLPPIEAAVPPPNETEKLLTRLEAEIKRLEAEYNMFFAGRLPKPPWETRSRVEALIKTIDSLARPEFRRPFRFATLQARYAAFVDLWDRGLRRPARKAAGVRSVHLKAGKTEEPSRPRIACCSSRPFAIPMGEMDKLHDLYESLADARRQAGSIRCRFTSSPNW
jgi:hypothetical protein